MLREMAVRGLLFFSVLAMVQDGVATTANGANFEAALNFTARISGSENYVCDDVSNPRRGECPTDWSFIADSEGAPCLRIINTEMSYDAASSFCSNLGGNLLTIRSEKRQQVVEEIGVVQKYTDRSVMTLPELEPQTYHFGHFNEFLPFRFTSNAWIGLRRNPYSGNQRFSWQTERNSPLSYINSDDYNIFRSYCCGQDCGYLGGSNRMWGATGCSANMQFICEKEQVCEAGVFGAQCNQVCHCYGEACSSDQPCKYGCEQGWMGPYCCTRKRKAEIIYYCVNSATDGRYLLVRINPFGVAYDRLQMLGEDGRAIPWCNGTHISRDSAGIYSIKITVSEEIEEHEGSTCAGNKTGENTFEWLLSLEEKTGVLLPPDRRVQLSCDFDKAESMARAHSQDFIKDSEKALEKNFVPPTETQTDSQEEVVLEVTDAYSGNPLSKARLGANVQLKMKLTVSTALMAKGVSPYRCVASSSDGQYTQELTDDNGCPKFIVSELKGGNGTAKSEPFQLFTFPGYHYVVISCSFQLCFLPNETLCSDRCLARRILPAQSSNVPKYDHDYDDGDDRLKRAITAPKTATTFIYIVTDPDSDAGAKSDQPEHTMTSQPMGPVSWALLAICVCVSAALAYVIIAKKRSRLRHRLHQQRHQESLLAARLESTEDQAAL